MVGSGGVLAPPGATDTHMHFYGPYDRWPLSPLSPNTPPEASVAAYRQVQARLGLSPGRVVLFEGEPEEIRFVTSTPPLALDAPQAAFHAVVLGRTERDSLRLIERVVPSDEPFAPGPGRVLSPPEGSVTPPGVTARGRGGRWSRS